MISKVECPWQDLVLFNEYFHGDDGSGVVAKLLQQSGERVAVSSEAAELEGVLS
jgi:hypothetical protein